MSGPLNKRLLGKGPICVGPIGKTYEGRLNFDAQIGTFTVGNTITGAISGTTATIVLVIDNGTDGVLYLSRISGTFQDGEIFLESALGSELLDEGGFENFTGTEDDGISDTFIGWTNKNVNDGNGDKVEATLTKYSGSYAVKLTKTLTSFTGVLSGLGDIAVTAENFYMFSFYTRGDGSIAGYYSVYDRTNSQWITRENGVQTDRISTDINGTVYTLVEFVFMAPVGCAAIDVSFKCFDVGTVYFDAGSVKQITNAALANGVVY